MRTYKNLMLIAFSIPMIVRAQQAQIVAGPMIGYVEHREVALWVQTQCAKNISIKYWPVGSNKKKTELTETKFAEGCTVTPLTFILTNLDMGTTYSYEILLDGKVAKIAYPLMFKTKTLWEWRTDAPDFSFMLGSCFYVNDSLYDRPGKPYGQGTEIINKMLDKPTDFMLWLGDNVYTREADYSSASGLTYRYQHTRADKNLQAFLASRPNYAIWDDHDFGPNDAGKSYDLKKISRELFIKYWPAKSYGQDDEGIYSKFRFNDADFFLLDNRYFRDENNWSEKLKTDKTQLGEKQLLWLFNSLLYSNAKFKFIVMGGQFLNTATVKESYVYYKNEREKILKFIVDNKITGVVFLSGDRHHTELLMEKKYKSKLGYNLIELTASPLSAAPNINISKTPEFNNPLRVSNTLVAENNFCTIQIKGPKNERVVVFSCYDKYGALRWEAEFNQADLGVTPKDNKANSKSEKKK
jgi:alkaline phosphatase D